ncbi:MAG: hypothetical protein JF593_03100 [Novosphingobium sp.]|nr:hypothetical protein [Novosphingobium sp.]
MTTRHVIAFAAMVVMALVFGLWARSAFRRSRADREMRKGKRRKRKNER